MKKLEQDLYSFKIDCCKITQDGLICYSNALQEYMETYSME